MSLSRLFDQAGGYYALPVFALLFGDAVWWRIHHRNADVKDLPLTILLVPPILIMALGAWSADTGHGWQWSAIVALAAVEVVLAAVFYRSRERRWPGAPVLVGAAVVWTCFILLSALLALSGDSL